MRVSVGATLAVVVPAAAIVLRSSTAGSGAGTGRIATVRCYNPRRRTASPPSFCDEDVHGQARRDPARVVPRRCRGQTLGRLATRIAGHAPRQGQAGVHAARRHGRLRRRRQRREDHGDGLKLDTKIYYRHSGYPGGIRQRTLREQLERRPTEVIRKAVKGMLPKNKLASAQITKLKVYAGPDHPHAAQAPKPMELP